METPNPTKEQLQQHYTQILKRAGYNPTIDDDGDVAFIHESQHLFIATPEDDALFFRIFCPILYFITDDELQPIVNAATTANMENRLAKAFLVQHLDGLKIWIASEMLLTHLDQASHYLGTCLRAIQNTRNSLFEHLENPNSQEATEPPISDKKHTPESLASLRESIRKQLFTDGFRPTLTADGEIMFKINNTQGFVQTSSNDFESVKIGISLPHPIPTNSDPQKIKHACLMATGSTKVGKLWPDNGGLCCSIDLPLPNPNDTIHLLIRACRISEHILNTFKTVMHGK